MQADCWLSILKIIEGLQNFRASLCMAEPFHGKSHLRASHLQRESWVQTEKAVRKQTDNNLAACWPQHIAVGHQALASTQRL